MWAGWAIPVFTRCKIEWWNLWAWSLKISLACTLGCAKGKLPYKICLLDTACTCALWTWDEMQWTIIQKNQLEKLLQSLHPHMVSSDCFCVWMSSKLCVSCKQRKAFKSICVTVLLFACSSPICMGESASEFGWYLLQTHWYLRLWFRHIFSAGHMFSQCTEKCLPKLFRSQPVQFP